jgi:hypothetical protein
VLKALLAHDFPGVEELRVQSRDVLARPGCGCGCGTIHLFPQGPDLPASPAKSPVPVEGTFRDAVGGILLFVHNGFLSELEVHSFEEEPLLVPEPHRIQWLLRIGQSTCLPLSD